MLIGGIVARPRPRAARRRDAREPRLRPAAPCPAALPGGPSATATEFALDQRQPHRGRRVRLPLLATGFAAPARRALGEPRATRASRWRSSGSWPMPSRSSSNGGYMPVWEPSLAGRRAARDRRSSALHVIVVPAHGIDARLPRPLGPVRRRHPDPDADHPQRRHRSATCSSPRASRSSCSRRSFADPDELPRGAGATALGRRVAGLRLEPAQAAAAEAAAMLETGALIACRGCRPAVETCARQPR